MGGPTGNSYQFKIHAIKDPPPEANASGVMRKSVSIRAHPWEITLRAKDFRVNPRHPRAIKETPRMVSTSTACALLCLL